MVGEVLERLRPALEAAVSELRQKVEALVGELVGSELAQGAGLRRIGETKRCRVCGLEGARNEAHLPRGHSRADHQRYKLKLQPADARPRKRNTAAEADPLHVAG
jgi:hypothetical protein